MVLVCAGTCCYLRRFWFATLPFWKLRTEGRVCETVIGMSLGPAPRSPEMPAS